MKFYKRIRGEEDKVDAVINYIPGLIVLQMKVGTFTDSFMREKKSAFIALDIVYGRKILGLYSDYKKNKKIKLIFSAYLSKS